MLDPPLKCVGGKRWLATQLASEIAQHKPRLYVEPFLGGGAVALSLHPSTRKLLGDANRAFANVWTALKTTPVALFHRLEELRKQYPDSALGYAQARDQLNGELRKDLNFTLGRAALTLHINYRCFNGLWRVNGNGMFNVPWGKYKKPRRFTLDELKAYADVLKGTNIVAHDFRDTLRLGQAMALNGGVLVFADPPYDGVFDGYTNNGFTESDQIDLAGRLASMARAGAKVISTNADTPLIRDAYSWADVQPLVERHIVGAKGDRRGKRGCVIIRSK